MAVVVLVAPEVRGLAFSHRAGSGLGSRLRGALSLLGRRSSGALGRADSDNSLTRIDGAGGTVDVGGACTCPLDSPRIMTAIAFVVHQRTGKSRDSVVLYIVSKTESCWKVLHGLLRGS